MTPELSLNLFAIFQTYEARQKLAKDQWLADKSAYKASKDAAASEDVVVASPSETAEVGV